MNALHLLRAGAVLLMLLAPPCFSAPTAALSTQEIARYQSQLADARSRQSALGGALECLVSRDAVLVARRDAGQLRLGEMRQREPALRATVAREQAACDEYRETLRHEERNLEQLRGEHRALQMKRAAQEQAVRECKASFWTINALCDAAADIAHWIGAFERTEGQVRALESRLDRNRQALQDAQARLQQSRGTLEQASAALGELDARIRHTEGEIGAVQAELSALRGQAQAHQTLLDEFTDALAQARLIDTDDDRARTARRLRDAAQRFDAGASRLAAAVVHASTVLPAESAACVRR